MAKTERIEIRASSAFIDRLEEMASQMKVSKAEVIRTAIDTLELLAKNDREGKEIQFVPKQKRVEPKEAGSELISDALKSLEDMIVATSALAESDTNVSKAREGAIKTLKEAGMSLLNCKVREGTIILPEPDMYDEGC
jgi:hypothetical protein